eukprot:TRINITY_DN9028_c0_g1_i1.p1 TRINITY_DN9028_c0_g1~~TRINITY_DN9028_c0_g1_i1.p1  ORF type:complete len:1082 (+),score=177.39 TRINITY_DN9028_c0_g1_i1:13-3258(+)
MERGLYHVEINKPGMINQSVSGAFCGVHQGNSQFVVLRGSNRIELLYFDGETVGSICYQMFYALIRCMQVLKSSGSYDRLVLSLDCGRVVVLEYNEERNNFEDVYSDQYKYINGCKRNVAGQYLACDPHGSSFIISGIEEHKVGYHLRDGLSLPLEISTDYSIVFDCIGLDTGLSDNQMYACIEVNYSDSKSNNYLRGNGNTEKLLIFYNLDTISNQLVKLSSEPIVRTANLLIPVPGGEKGPGGLIILAEDNITYRNIDHPDRRAKIPKRNISPFDKSVLLVAYVLINTETDFFYLVQSEYGDLYKITLLFNDQVTDISIVYYDTIPVTTSLTYISPGYLFIACESGNQLICKMKFEELGEPMIIDDNDILFNPQLHKNLEVISELNSIGPVVNVTQYNPFGSESPLLYLLCGKGPNSSLRILNYGASLNERASCDLFDYARAVFSVKNTSNDLHHKYIVVSFRNKTLVLEVGESIRQVNSCFDNGVATFDVGIIGDDTTVQIHTKGIRYFKSGELSYYDWTPVKPIVLSAINSKQIVVVLEISPTLYEISYIELENDELVEINRFQYSKGIRVNAISLSPATSDIQYLAVADAQSNLRIFSLSREDSFRCLSSYKLNSKVKSLLFSEVNGELHINAGDKDGKLLGYTFTGSEIRARTTVTVGNKPVKICSVEIDKKQVAVSLSTKTWITFNSSGGIKTIPLGTLTPFNYVTSFCSEDCPEGIVAVSGTTMCIYSIDDLDQPFRQEVIPLSYTPKASIVNPQNDNLIIIQGDDGTYSKKEREEIARKQSITGDINADEKTSITDPAPDFGTWASCVSSVDLNMLELNNFELEGNESVVSISICRFVTRKLDIHVVIGTVKDLVYSPNKSFKCGNLRTYIMDTNSNFEFIHSTEISEVPTSLCEFQGRLAVGAGNSLLLYDLGNKNLVKRCEYKGFKSPIKTIWEQSERLIVGEYQGSFHVMKYSYSENKFFDFAKDPNPRLISCGISWDENTIVGADKLGNIFVLKLPEYINDEFELNYSSNDIFGFPYKLITTRNFYIGESIVYLGKTRLTASSKEIIIYITIYGTIGALIPITSSEKN